MKYLLVLLILVGCSTESQEPKQSISLYSCERIAKMIDGSFAYTPDEDVSCTVYIEKGEYAFYSDDEERGISFGLAMAVNRPKLKDFYKCIESQDLPDNATTEESVIVDRRCRKKLGMKDTY